MISQELPAGSGMQAVLLFQNTLLHETGAVIDGHA